MSKDIHVKESKRKQLKHFKILIEKITDNSSCYMGVGNESTRYNVDCIYLDLISEKCIKYLKERFQYFTEISSEVQIELC